MIYPQDALLLAVTKLKTRRLRLIITVVVAGILFVVLTAASLVVNGVFNSIESFSEEGFGKRYLLSANPVFGYEVYTNKGMSDPSKLAEVKAAFEKLKKDKAAAAKRLGVSYDPASESSPIIVDPVTSQEVYDEFDPLVLKLFGNQNVDQEATQQVGEALDTIMKNYNGVGVYQSIPLGPMAGPVSSHSAPTVRVLKDGVEEVSVDGQQQEFMGPSTGLKGIEGSLAAYSEGMLKDFLLPGQDFVAKDNAVPIIVPYKASEEILGLTPLQSGTDAGSRLDRVKKVRTDIAGKTFQVCFRNQTSIERQNLAIQQQSDFAQNKDKKTYTKPELMYDVSDQPCQDVVVTRDVRSATTKKYDQNYEQFEREFGKVDAAQRIVTFRVVGVSPDQPEFAGFSVTDIIKSILSSYIGQGWYIPTSVGGLLPEYAADLAKPVGTVEKFSYPGLFIEVGDADSARRAVKELSCKFTFDAFTTPESQTEAAQACADSGKALELSPYGSNSLALEEARSGFRRLFPQVLLVVAGISALIMMGTVGKIIADSRRETAVFRAIGAKRFDIAQIYLTYTLLIALLISIVALGIGWLMALYVQSRYSESITVEAILSFNAQDLTRRFGLIGINPREIALLVAVIVVGSLLSAFLPLLSNLRRSPIRDMRDER